MIQLGNWSAIAELKYCHYEKYLKGYFKITMQNKKFLTSCTRKQGIF
jgi:hypothetical protein